MYIDLAPHTTNQPEKGSTMHTTRKALAVTAAAAAVTAVGWAGTAQAATAPATLPYTSYAILVSHPAHTTEWDVALRNFSLASNGRVDEAVIFVDGVETRTVRDFSGHTTLRLGYRAGHTIDVQVSDWTDPNFDGVRGVHRSNVGTFSTNSPAGQVRVTYYYPR